MNFRIVAHILLAPCCLVLLDTLVVWTWISISEPTLPGFLLALPFLAYYFVPSAFGVIYLLLCQVAVAVAWKISPPPSRARCWLPVYEVVLLVYFGYLAWWFTTGQQTKTVGGYL